MQLFLSREVLFFKLFAERQCRSDQIDSIRSMAISVQNLDTFCTKVNDFNRIMFLIFLVPFKKNIMARQEKIQQSSSIS